MHKFAFLTLLLTAISIKASDTLQLKECISIGIKNNLTLLNSRIDIEKGETFISQNRARLLPTINGIVQLTDYLKRPANVTTGTLLGNDFPENPTWQTIQSMQYNANAGLYLAMPLYDQTILSSIEVSKVLDRLNRVSYQKAIDDLTIHIAKVYYLAQSSLEHLKLVKENIIRMQELYDITTAMFEAGIVLEIDLSRVNINLRNLEALQDQYQTIYLQQLNIIRFLIDLSPETPFNVARLDDKVHNIIHHDLATNLPEVKLIDTKLELTQQQIRAVKSEYLPSISFSGYLGGVGYQEHFSHFFHTHESSQNVFANFNIGVSIKIPIFDGRQKWLKLRQYKFDHEKLLNEHTKMVNNLKQHFDNANLQFNQRLSAYHIQHENYTQAREVYLITEEKYKEGIASMSELLQDEMRLRNAQSSYIQSQYQCMLSQLELLRLSDNLECLSK